MILIAPDKYRGTLTAPEAAQIIDSNIGRPCIILPMADGGEGTARCIARGEGWIGIENGAYFNQERGEIAIDSANSIGYTNFDAAILPLERTSAPLAVTLNSLFYKYNPKKIYVAVGGTATCDGGKGFLENLDNTVDWKKILTGLIDVQVPLLPSIHGGPSALMFCAQKGFKDNELPIVKDRLESVVRQFGSPASPFDGAGGGMGYALASVLGVECHSGAGWIVEHADIPWEKVRMIITGEGRFDRQSLEGKVVSVLLRKAREHGIPLVCMAGCIADDAPTAHCLKTVDLSQYLPEDQLTPEIAARRLAEATKQIINEWNF